MESLFSFDLTHFIQTIGVLGVGAIVFAESGLLIGIVFPGDSLLFTAGLLASQGVMRIDFLVAVTTVAAFTGNIVGYRIGALVGPKIFSKQHSRFFKEEYAHRTRVFFERHGSKTVIVARFLPIVRTCVPIFAGVGRMDKKRFIRDSAFGSVLWGGLIPLGGFGLGKTIPDIDRYLIPIIGAIIFFSFLPTFLHIQPRKK